MLRRLRNLWRLSGMDIKSDGESFDPTKQRPWLEEEKPKQRLAIITSDYDPVKEVQGKTE